VGFRTVHQCLSNTNEDALDPLVNIIVPEADYSVAFRLDQSSSRLVLVGSPTMLAAIDFHHKSS
jgi:hypothetical protein